MNSKGYIISKIKDYINLNNQDVINLIIKYDYSELKEILKEIKKRDYLELLKCFNINKRLIK